jgi:hypothetical protein
MGVYHYPLLFGSPAAKVLLVRGFAPPGCPGFAFFEAKFNSL